MMPCAATLDPSGTDDLLLLFNSWDNSQALQDTGLSRELPE